MSQDSTPKDAGPDEQRKTVKDQDTEGHKRESAEDPLSARPRQPLAIPDNDEADTEGHKH